MGTVVAATTVTWHVRSVSDGPSSSLLNSFTGLLRPTPRPIDMLLKPLSSFAHHKLAGAGLLMLATVVALVWANSAYAHDYHHLLETYAGVTIGEVVLKKSLHHWINDGLMGIFFFYVGLEIKREVLVGELSTLRKATLPAIAALGGMVVPAALYFALNRGGAAASGWGIPMATDIAFALGVLALLGKRVPLGLKVFLTALAIVDDIGAVVVIAVFYTEGVSIFALLAGTACLLMSVVLNRLGTRSAVAYFVVGTLAWLGFLESGVHATIAAILMAFTIPARTRIDGVDFMDRMRLLMARLETQGVPETTALNTSTQQHLFERMNETIDHASAPLQRIEHALHVPVTFFVLPIFALANAGVTLKSGLGGLVGELGSPMVLGIVVGLFVGKTAGITLASWIAVKAGLADLPKGVSWKQLTGAGTLAGIGFTMALFIAGLAFSDPAAVEQAKVGILAASLLSGVVGYLLVRMASSGAEKTGAA